MLTTETTLVITLIMLLILVFMGIFYGVFHLSDITLESSAYLLLALIERFEEPLAHPFDYDQQTNPLYSTYNYKGKLTVANPLSTITKQEHLNLSVNLRYKKFKKTAFLYASGIYNRIFEKGIYDVD